ncbi:MAG: hypothetical protein ACLQIQ_12010 [Beijerinckiaceae bacterium]
MTVTMVILPSGRRHPLPKFETLLAIVNLRSKAETAAEFFLALDRSAMTSPSYPRPALALRIGITGARSLDASQCKRLSDQVKAILAAAREEMRDLAENDQNVRADYHHEAGAAPQPVLRFISPLARGADRLAAREALALDYTLHVPMPFPKAEYEKDFDTPEDLAEFRTLFKAAGEDWLALDGDHGPEVNRAYEAVGRYVVRHCDVLIAIWDGGPGGGQGGTADIVHYAARSGVPICWLHATQDCEPVWITDIYDLRFPDGKKRPAVATALPAYLKALVPPPPRWKRHRHGIVGWLAHVGQDRNVSPEAEHFAEGALGRHWLWRAYATFIRWFSGGHDQPWSAPRKPDDPAAGYWFDRYEPTNERAGEYAARYRSAYVWVFLLGTSALIFGATALVLSHLTPSAAPLHEILDIATEAFTGAEFIALCLIFVLVWIGLRREWHERSIEYRLLAELCRKQQVLAPLGWALPIVAVQGMAAAESAEPEKSAPPKDHAGHDRGAWVAWLFAAEQRAAPLPRGELASTTNSPAGRAALEDLITEQLTYHQDRSKMAKAASHALERWGEGLFIIVVLCVVAKLAFAHRHDLADWAVLFGWLATVLPAVSAAFVGIRAYAELQLLDEQSRHMAAELKRAQTRVERLRAAAAARPLVSQDFGLEAVAVAMLMLQDLDGWARLFRVKGIAPG